MPGCTYSCLNGTPESHIGACCHTCAYYLDRRCRAPSGWGYYPRALMRMLREA